jgi:hypothetical protein
MTKHLIISPDIDEKWASKSNENLPMPKIRVDIQRGRGPTPAHVVYYLTNRIIKAQKLRYPPDILILIKTTKS